MQLRDEHSRELKIKSVENVKFCQEKTPNKHLRDEAN